MKTAFLIIALIASSFAQFEELDQETSDCQARCCASYNGTWDGDSCDIEGDALNGYYGCSSICLEYAGRGLEYTSRGNICCAPAFLALGLVLAVLWR
jgi:hypothetical protein